jgi:RNA methyltransferase, TrmH family
LKIIQSEKNPQIKQWRKLHTRKERDKTGTFIVEGFHLVEEALKNNDNVIDIIINEGAELPSRWDIGTTPVTMVPNDIFRTLSETEAPQGILAICHQIQHQLQEEELKTLLLIDAVQDPGNLGTMIRTADAAGIDAVIVGRGSVDIYNSKVLRSAQGSHFHLPVISGDLGEWIENLHGRSIPVFGTALENAQTYTQTSAVDAFGLIVGNEGNGVNKDLLGKTTANLYVPLFGKSESLNVAVATGILLYHLRTV